MKIKLIPFPDHLIVLALENHCVIRLKLSPSDVALVHAETGAYLASLVAGSHPKPLLHQSGDFLEVIRPPVSQD